MDENDYSEYMRKHLLEIAMPIYYSLANSVNGGAAKKKRSKRKRPAFDTAKFIAEERDATCKTVAGLKSMVEKEFEV